MVKAHIQIPDDLHRRAKAVARDKEWSFAEVVRRGLEYMVEVNPGAVNSDGSEWVLPVIPAPKGALETTSQELQDAIDQMRDEGV